jgi:hypothetical protein
MDGRGRLVGSISRYLDGAGALPPAGPEAALEGSRAASSERCGWGRGCGGGSGSPTPWVVLGRRRFTTDLERVLFALVANRAVDP